MDPPHRSDVNAANDNNSSDNRGASSSLHQSQSQSHQPPPPPSPSSSSSSSSVPGTWVVRFDNLPPCPTFPPRRYFVPDRRYRPPAGSGFGGQGAGSVPSKRTTSGQETTASNRQTIPGKRNRGDPTRTTSASSARRTDTVSTTAPKTASARPRPIASPGPDSSIERIDFAKLAVPVSPAASARPTASVASATPTPTPPPTPTTATATAAHTRDAAFIQAGYCPHPNPPQEEPDSPKKPTKNKSKQPKMTEPRARAARHKGQMNFPSECKSTQRG